MVTSARLPRSPLSQLLSVLVFVVVADLLVASAVFVDRLDDSDVPDFRRLSVTGLRWTVSPYEQAPAVLGFTTRVGAEDRDMRPDLAARYSIAALVRFDETKDRRWVRRAASAMDGLLDQADDGLVPHNYKATDLLGRRIPAPWFAADTQGIVLSALARLYEVSGDARWRRAADDVFAALGSFQGFFAGGRPAPETWLSIVDSKGFVWFDRFSTGLTSTQVLTEQLWTLLGIYDYRRALADRDLERRKSNALLGGSLATLRHYLQFWRVPGRISVSSIQIGNRDVRGHFVAAEQLRLLGEITRMGWVVDAADAYDRDRNPPFFPVKPVTASADVDVYDPAPRELARLARTGRPERLADPSIRQPDGAADDPLRLCAQALTLLAEPANPGAVARAADLVERVMSTAESGAVPHYARLEDITGDRVKAPWYSSATQGLLLSALVRLHERTGEPRWRRDADEVFAALRRVRDYGPPSTRPWFGLIDFGGNLYFDQNLGASIPPRSIYEHATAVIGFYDYWRLTRNEDAFSFFAGGVTTLRDALPLVRMRDRPAVESIATLMSDPAFHGLITSETDALADVTGDTRLARYARQLREDYP